MENKVSIIVPVYNIEKYLERCVDTLVKQTDRNIEILLINDGTEDNSLDIMERYASQDSRVKVINKENGGSSSARNLGISLATGKFIMFVDSDDWMELNAVKEMKKMAIEKNADIVKAFYQKNTGKVSQIQNMEIGTEILEVDKKDFKEKIYPLLINTSVLNSVWIELIKKDIVINNNIKFIETINYGEDQLFNYELYTHSSKVVLLNRPYYHYFYNNNSITTSKGIDKTKSRSYNALKNYSKLYQYIKDWGMDNESVRKQIAKRVMREVTNRTKEAFVLSKYNVSKEEITSYIKEIWNDKIFMKSIEINNKEKYGMKGIENKLYENVISKGNINKYITRGINIYNIKHFIKRCLKKV